MTAHTTFSQRLVDNGAHMGAAALIGAGLGCLVTAIFCNHFFAVENGLRYVEMTPLKQAGIPVTILGLAGTLTAGLSHWIIEKNKATRRLDKAETFTCEWIKAASLGVAVFFWASLATFIGVTATSAHHYFIQEGRLDPAFYSGLAIGLLGIGMIAVWYLKHKKQLAQEEQQRAVGTAHTSNARRAYG
jgi:hypothetical protein